MESRIACIVARSLSTRAFRASEFFYSILIGFVFTDDGGQISNLLFYHSNRKTSISEFHFNSSKKTHFQLSHKLKCNRHQFFHAVHHITGVQDFYIHREFFLTKVHEMPQVDGQVLLFRQLQNEGCAVVTAS